MDIYVAALLFGLLEGLTEFLPVSSTGHLILLGEILPVKMPEGHVFEIAIQCGSMCAVMAAYAGRMFSLFSFGRGYFTRNRWALLCLLAFLPSALVGVTAYGFIKSVLFSAYVVCASLIVGGIAMIWAERFGRATRHTESVEGLGIRQALSIGCCQALSVIPGTSRSACTIVGGMLFGLDRRTAAEFSFLLALPTLFAATAYDLYKQRAFLDVDALSVIAIGFVVSFVVALLTVKGLLRFVSRHSFAPFAVYRILLGTAGFAFLLLR